METKNWKCFRVGDLFNVELTKGDIKADRTDDGPIPLISSGESNNGIVKYILEEGDGKAEKFSANNITLDMFCHAYYQPYEFYAVGHGRVNILKPKFKLNKYLAMFICSLIDNELYRFSYGRAVYSNVANNVKLKFPAIQNTNGDYEPDWQWIENYVQNTLIPKLPQKVKSVWQKQFDTTPLSPNKLKLNTKEWKWFYLTDVFSLKRGKRLTKPEREKGTIPLITAGRENEGVAEYISNEEQAKYKNAITIDMFGFSCYRGYEFCCDDNILVLQNKHLTCFSGLFISSIISNDEYKCAYGRQYRQKTFMVHKIKLPADLLGNPDWQWMEDYIKGLPYSACL